MPGVFTGLKTGLDGVLFDILLNAAERSLAPDDVVKALGLPEVALAAEVALDGACAETFP